MASVPRGRFLAAVGDARSGTAGGVDASVVDISRSLPFEVQVWVARELRRYLFDVHGERWRPPT